jgi:hypothetical protein
MAFIRQKFLLNYSDSKKTKNEESVPIEIKFEVCPTLKKKTKKILVIECQLKMLEGKQ